MNLWRLRVLKKLAQTTPAAPATGQQGAQTTVGSASASPPASSFMTSLDTGWGPQTGGLIDTLISNLDKAIVAGTEKKYNFKMLYDSSFPSGLDSSYSSPVKDLIMLARKVYQNLLNNKTPFSAPMNSSEKVRLFMPIKNAPEISKFSQVNSGGALAAAGVTLSSIQQNVNDIWNSIPKQ